MRKARRCRGSRVGWTSSQDFRQGMAGIVSPVAGGRARSVGRAVLSKYTHRGQPGSRGFLALPWVSHDFGRARLCPSPFRGRLGRSLALPGSGKPLRQGGSSKSGRYSRVIASCARMASLHEPVNFERAALVAPRSSFSAAASSALALLWYFAASAPCRPTRHPWAGRTCPARHSGYRPPWPGS